MAKLNFKDLVAGAVIGGGVFLLLDALFMEKYFFKVKEENVGEPLDTKDKIRFILLTDIQLVSNLLPQQKRLARKINNINPDLLLIAGDAIGDKGNTNTLQSFLNLLKNSILKVAIMGKHENITDNETKKVRSIYNRFNGDLLINESKVYNVRSNRIAITGVDDCSEGIVDFNKAVENIKRERNHLLLVRSPLQQKEILQQINGINNVRDDEEQLDISYIFSGHKDSAQIALGSIATRPEKAGPFIHGWYNDQRPYLYVAKGIGKFNNPFRFNSRSEIIVFNYQV